MAPRNFVPEQLPPDLLAGTPFEQFPRPSAVQTSAEPIPYVDELPPASQFEYLVRMIEDDDAAKPAPFTGTPPWGEYDITNSAGITPDVLIAESYAPPPDIEAAAEADLPSLIDDAHGQGQPDWTWQNDDQMFGLGVPPGAPNIMQPVEYGRTQAVPSIPAAEHGWDAWSGRPALARVPRHENNFPLYSAGVNRGLGQRPVEKMVMPYALLTQQYRDMLLTELRRRGVHNVVVADVPSVPFTEQVEVVDPTALQPEPFIGAEGVLPY